MEITEAVRSLDRDLKAVFGDRLRSVVAYGDAGGSDQAPAPTLVVVNGLTADDLRACADRMAAWHGAGLATPLILGAEEFGRSLDAFPYEFGAILADHLVVSGENCFEGLKVDPAHLRQACEVQARSHLLHLREGYLETRGRSDALAELLSRSMAPFAALIKSVARLQGDGAGDVRAAAAAVEHTLAVPAGTLTALVNRSGGSLSSDEARRIFPGYLEAVERLTQYIDRWNADGR